LLAAVGFFASLQFALLEDALATTVIAQKLENASFRQWVDATPEIVLARVVAVRKLPEDEWSPFYPKLEYEFTFETVERIKGHAPTTFTLRDQLTPEWVKVERRLLEHRILGEFWLAFTDVDEHIGFEIDGTYLLFKTAKGHLAQVGGREAEPIKSTGDKWLVAVKRLVSDSRATHGRDGTLLELLTSSHLIVLATTTRCKEYAGGSQGPTKLEIKEQLWGLPTTFVQLRPYDPVGIEQGCELNGERLIIVLDEASERHVIRLRVEPTSQTVDFSGLVNGTTAGLIEVVGGPLWSSQVKISGPTKWTIAELRQALKDAAAGRASPFEVK
jgi:hypothetical protein